MEFRDIMVIVNQMYDAGIEAYVIKNTVFDIIEKKASSNVQLAVSTSIRKVADFFKAHNYTITEQKPDVLFGQIDGTSFGIATLRYITYEEFVKRILRTDFTVNTLLMNRNEQVKDLFGALNHIRSRTLVPVEGFDISKAGYSYGLFKDIATKLFVYDFWTENNAVLDALFDYFRRFHSKPSAQQRKRICQMFCQYAQKVDEDSLKTNLKVKNFLSITTLYVNNACDEYNPDGIRGIISLPREWCMAIIAYLYDMQFTEFEDSKLYKAIKRYTGDNLNDEQIYDTAIDEYGFEIIDAVIKTKQILGILSKTPFTVPSYHHESVFLEVEKRTDIPWVDVFESSPLEKGFEYDDADYLDATSSSTHSNSVKGITTAYNDSFFDSDDKTISEITESEEKTDNQTEKEPEIDVEQKKANAKTTSKDEYEDVFTRQPDETVVHGDIPAQQSSHSEATTDIPQNGNASEKTTVHHDNPPNPNYPNNSNPYHSQTGRPNYPPQSQTGQPAFMPNSNTGSAASTPTPQNPAPAVHNDKEFVKGNDWKNGSTVNMYQNALRRAATRK